MNERETPMDALDRRLAAYLEGHAEAAAAFGPGPDHIVASMAIGGRHVALQGRPGGGGLRGVPIVAWALLMMGLLSAMALAFAAGSARDDSLVVVPPASPAPSVTASAPIGVASPLDGFWKLDFEASGIEGSYTQTSSRKPGKVPVASSLEFAAGAVAGATGGGGGCDHFEGTYSDADGRFTIVVPVAAGNCGRGPVFPDLEVRQRLADTAAWVVDGEELRLLNADGTPLLVYRRPAIDTP